jgi:hypothetical protein
VPRVRGEPDHDTRTIQSMPVVRSPWLSLGTTERPRPPGTTPSRLAGSEPFIVFTPAPPERVDHRGLHAAGYACERPRPKMAVRATARKTPTPLSVFL